MLAPARVIRSNARIALKGKMLSFAAAAVLLLFAVLIGSFVSDIFSMISGYNVPGMFIGAAFCVFIAVPLLLGVLRYFWRSLFECEDRLTVLFCYFSSRALYWRAVQTALYLVLYTAGWGIVCLLPAGAAQLLLSPEFYAAIHASMPDFTANLWIVYDCLATIGVVWLLFMLLRYYLVPFLIVADEQMEIAEAVHMSRLISRRTAFDYVSLIFSFAGWILLSLTAVPLIFTVPYFIMAYLVHARFAVAQYNRVVHQMNRTDYAVGF